MTRYKIDSEEKTPSYDVRGTCPHCRYKGVFSRIYHEQLDVVIRHPLDPSAPATVEELQVGTRRCPNPQCSSLIFIIKRGPELVESWPSQTIDFDPANLPPLIVRTLEEAINCHAVGAYRAAALMVRRLLEEICRDRGAEGKDLYARIEALGSKIVVPQELISATHHLRLMGNDAAHLDAKTYDDVGKDEADLALALVKELLKATYQYADLLSRLKSFQKGPTPAA